MPRLEQTRHSFFFFFHPSYCKIAKELFWTVLVGVCTQKDNLHARVCTDSISYVYSDFNCSGLCAANIIWRSYLHEAAEIWHWLWGCAGVFIKRQPCSRALETDPICSRPGWVVKNSSKCGPQGFHPPHLPALCPSICNIFVLLLRVGSRGQTLSPTEEEWWGGCGTLALMETASRKWPSGSEASWARFTLTWA